MKNKANLFVCVFIALSINLQCSISAFASGGNDTLSLEEQNLKATDIKPENTEDQEIIINGTDLSVRAFTPDDQTQ